MHDAAKLPAHIRRRIVRVANQYDHQTGSPLIHIPNVLTTNLVTVHDNVLDNATIQEALQESQRLLQTHGKQAQMGGQATGGVWGATEARGDTHVWLTPSLLANNDHPTLTAVATQLAAQLPAAFKAAGLIEGPGRLSMQLAQYPGQGEGYVRHVDRGPAAPDRLWTVLLYLNADWQPQHGGCLHIEHSCCPTDTSSSPPSPSATAATTTVAPCGGRLVVFDARLPHTVLLCHAPRVALTVWVCQKGSSGRAGCAPQLGVAGDDDHSDTYTAPAYIAPAHMPHPISPLQIAMPTQQVPPPQWTMFISIASYRDPETYYTMHHLFTQAHHPAWLRVGVVWQVDMEVDTDVVRVPQGYASQVRQVVLSHKEATGPCNARALAQRLYAGETFVLQIDAHCRFAKGWDAALVHMLQDAEASSAEAAAEAALENCKETTAQETVAQEAVDACLRDVKIILSTYPAGYTGEGMHAVCDTNTAPIALIASHFDNDGMLRTRGVRLSTPALPRPLAAIWWAAGFSFSRGRLVEEVPYLNNVPGLFFGEEPAMLLRYWQAGWDVYCPTHMVVFHQWSRSTRHTLATDGGIDPAARAASQAHVCALLTGKIKGPLNNGTHVYAGRSNIQDFYKHTGVDFATLHISSPALGAGVPGVPGLEELPGLEEQAVTQDT